MQTTRRLLCAAALVAAMASPGQGHALLNSQCGSAYAGQTSCRFFAVGPNLSVSGYTSTPGITVRVTDAIGRIEILSCTGQFFCSSSIGVPPTGTDSLGPPQGVGPLLCTVITAGSGSYRCQSTV